MSTIAFSRHPARRDVMVSVASVALVGAVAWGLAWSMERASYGTFAGALIGIALALLSVVIGRALARRESDPVIGRLLVIAPLLKLAMTVVRYGVAFVIYDGRADSADYHLNGIRLGLLYREGIFDADLDRAFVGTGFVRMLTGLLYSVIGPTQLGAFFVFSWLGFLGLYFFYRAFRLAVPEGDHRRYALLVFVLPSLLFWPSSLGKEAWMAFTLGIVAYGSARLLTSRRHGVPVAAVGLLGASAVRPHVAAMAGCALIAAYLFRRRPKDASIIAPIWKLAGILTLGVGLVLMVGQSKEVLGVDDFNTDAVLTALDKAGSRTDEGGSVFENEQTSLSPSKFPEALVGVLFRPFPWEAGNPQALIASAEGAFLLGLFILGWRRVVGAIRSVLRTPYIVLCLVYTVLFVYAFSSFSNFGILTRQRVQVLPFVIVLVCLPPFQARHQRIRRLLTADPVPMHAGERSLTT